ncbi:MAG: hypothetical protein H6577_12080 [Lewinellaceae bacterium]|nr:hypothetical protein [Lewinellaceae bacterium]
MKFQRILGIVLLVAAIFAFGNKLFSGMSSYLDDGAGMVFFALLIGIFLLFGLRQILRH